MKKNKNILMCILFVLAVFYPAVKIFFAPAKNLFVFKNVDIIVVLSTILSFYLCVSKEEFSKDSARVLAALITPLSIIGNAGLLLISRSYLVFFCGLISVICNICITLGKGDKDLENLSLIISGLLALPTFLVLIVGLLFSDFGSLNVVKTVESPSGKYYAEVIDCNEGALGGKTFVEIYRKEEDSHPFFFEKEEKSDRVYTGRWGEFENMEIYWADDNVLVINSQEYYNEFSLDGE